MDPIWPQYDNIGNRSLIKEGIRQELEEHGYTYSDTNPDLIVEFDFLIEEHIDTVSQRTTSYRYWKGFETDNFNYKLGTLIINVFENKRDILVWHGGAESFLDLDPQKVDRKVPVVVKRILRNFPYHP